MKKIVRGKYVEGSIRLLEDLKLNENSDVYVIVEEGEAEDILGESFGIWVDAPNYLEKLREETETRLKKLGVN